MIKAGFQKKASFQLDFMLKKTPKHKNRLTLFRVKIYAGNKKAYRYGEEEKKYSRVNTYAGTSQTKSTDEFIV